MARPARGLAPVGAVLLLVALACGNANPALGEWEIDRDENRYSAVLAAEVTDLVTLSLRRDAIVAGDTEIPVSWVVEGDTVTAVRADGRGEHRIEILPDDRMRVELPIGVTVVYRKHRKAGS